MQPGKSWTDRHRRISFSRQSTVAWIVFITILGTGVLCGVAAEKPGEVTPISARRWDPDEIRALPDGPERIDRELHRQGEYSRRWNMIHDLVGKQHVSRKSRDLLASRGLGSALFNKDSGGPGWPTSAQVQDDTLNVLIIRISFETNRDPHLTTVDPSGDFVLDPLADPKPLEVDPPPHNKAFYESHLEGLSEYYRFMSGGRLQIQGRVLPEDSDGSYKLTDVADYGPGADNFWTMESLERLVQDIMVAADQGTQADGSVNLADYDDSSPFSNVIFVHSGSDWQSDIKGDSPNDIPTFFVTLGEPIDLIGTNPDGDPGQLSECSIIPETTNQDDYPGSIAAAFYHEFGHALGLVDIYSTYTGLPSVGIWDLMDSGTNLPVTMGTITAENDTFIISATGVLPPSLSAWSKWFLGWLEMGELDGRENDYFLPGVGLPADSYPDYPQAYRAGLSTREWFLLENRWVPWDVSETNYNELRFEQDDDTEVVLYLAGERLGIWENSGLYDFFMPPGGLLVWHVNNDRIEEGLADNTINKYGDGLRLVEADGIQDIGILEAYVLGWYGSYLDPFGGSDPYGNPTGFEDLYVEGFPSSRNFDRSWSGLSLSGIGPVTPRTSKVMKFKANQGSVGKGFPFELVPVQENEASAAGGKPGPRGIVTESLTPVILAEGDQQVLVFADAAPDDWDGGFYPASLFYQWADGNDRWGGSESRIQALGAPLSGSPFLQTRADDGVDLVWGTMAGRVGLTHFPDYDMPTETWTIEVGETLRGGPTPLVWQTDSPRILCNIPPSTLMLLEGSGGVLGDALEITGPKFTPPTGLQVAVPLPGSSGADMVPVFSDQGWHLVLQDADGLASAPAFFPYARVAAEVPSLTAVVATGDTYQLHAFDSEGELGAWRIPADGSVVTDLGSILGVDEPLVAVPAVADVDGDGRDDLVLATDKRIFALRPDGVSLRGFPVRLYDLFPLPDSTSISGPVVVADGTGDGVNEIYFNTDGGHLIGLSATGRLLAQTPLRWAGRRTGGLAIGGPDDGRVLWLVSPGGHTGPPHDRHFINGRVIASGLANAPDEGSRTSEWLGPVGGAYRRGSEGSAKSLGPASPVSREMDKVVLYPNPVLGDGVTVRFFSAGSRPARLFIYNLQGEEVARADIPVDAGAVNEYRLPLPGIASGLYLARLEFDTGSGFETRTLTLAVEK
ncbi:MAG: immune inhibitor A [Candidatus Krumholzibacteria bacterium]|nr:immune inhibitor A [Candidatus Krumholzibacteria bacterium]